MINSMDKKASAGISGFLGIVVCIALYLLLRRFFPGLSVVFLVILGLAALAVLALVVVVIVLAFKKPKDEPGKPKTAEVTATLQQGRAKLMEIRRTAMYVKHRRVKEQTDEICAAADRILKTLKEQPENIADVQKFFSYYLPTLGKILRKFRQLEEGNVLTAETEATTVACLENIKVAMDRQYRNLFEDDIIDITAEMKVMSRILKGDGLLCEEDFICCDGTSEVKQEIGD